MSGRVTYRDYLHIGDAILCACGARHPVMRFHGDLPVVACPVQPHYAASFHYGVGGDAEVVTVLCDDPGLSREAARCLCNHVRANHEADVYWCRHVLCRCQRFTLLESQATTATPKGRPLEPDGGTTVTP